MKPKLRVDPLWVSGNSTLAQDLNPLLSTNLVSRLHTLMRWHLTVDYNDALWEGLQDASSYNED